MYHETQLQYWSQRSCLQLSFRENIFKKKHSVNIWKNKKIIIK
jgi:hypothetical protein